ncbi:MAG TPA: DUF3566 domain-containing protein [Micromonospora sp.]
MTETQAKSGAAGASTTPVDEEAAGGGKPATGRAAVGRAAVPGETSSPKFTRAPGMPAPPDQPDGDKDGRAATSAGDGARPDSGPVTATIPVVKPAAGGQRSGSGTETRPAGAGRVPPAGGSARTAGGASAVGAARVTEAVRAARTTVNSAASRGPRRARLNLKRIDPWSVMKFSAAVSVVLFIVVIVATSVLYLALDAMGVFKSVNSSLADLVSAGGGAGGGGFKITAKGVIGVSALIGLVNVVLFTSLATLGAFVYNVCADLVGGIELTLAERD